MYRNEWVDINGQKIFTRLYQQHFFSSGATIVFLHEALGSVAQWRDFPQKVSDKTGCDVLVYDRFGHGLSDSMLVKREKDYWQIEAYEVTPTLLNHFDIENPILYGHSDGGTIALLYAARFPTKAIITEAAHVVVENITLEGIRKAIEQKPFLIDRLGQYHGEKTETLFSAWSDTWLDTAFNDWSIIDILPAIKCPALIMQGGKDEYATEKQVQLISHGIGKKAKSVLIPNCGHAPHKEAQELVLKNIVAFFKTFTT